MKYLAYVYHDEGGVVELMEFDSLEDAKNNKNGKTAVKKFQYCSQIWEVNREFQRIETKTIHWEVK